VLALVLLAGMLALALYQFGRSGQLGRGRWLLFVPASYLGFPWQGFVGTITAVLTATGYVELFRNIPCCCRSTRTCWSRRI